MAWAVNSEARATRIFGFLAEHLATSQGFDCKFNDQLIGGQGSSRSCLLDQFPLPGSHTDVLVYDFFGGV